MNDCISVRSCPFNRIYDDMIMGHMQSPIFCVFSL